ncbi:DUF4145 domain-containing protein [Burkholderia sp. Bp9031]|uniref:DUF4145 domain-containing protein n=1 Tax=Burkholderia sp. Bp9031 TaxID=2184566 RepID=UPI0021AB4CF7|nr:DUF4145 domain-containing protein [Burkholderia sp. Bp9031]
MATIVHDCPHCGASLAAFVPIGATVHPKRADFWNLLATCPACGDPIAAVVWASDGPRSNPTNCATSLNAHHEYRVVALYPKPEVIPTPEHVPDAAARAFEQGTRCLGRGDYTPGAAMFRRCLEIALKKYTPEIEAWKLEKRIDKLATEGKITKDIQAWAHRVRLDGNDALHEEEEFTKESAGELMEFTRLLLTYLYTLPEKIRLRLNPKTE